MKHELSEMLAASKENPPPPRYTTDDVLAAGRKAQSRRRVLFTGVGSAAAVVAVAAAIAVPQMVSRNTPTTNPAVPAAAGGAKKAQPFAYPVKDFTATIGSFKSGELSVSGALQVTTSYEATAIVAPGTGDRYQDDKGKIHSTLNDVGTLVIYKKGVFNPALAQKTGKATKLSTGVGYYVAGKFVPVSPADLKKLGNQSTPSILTWQYATDSWAVATIRGQAKVSETGMINLAQKVISTTPSAVKVGFKVGHVPTGFQLEGAGTSDSGLVSPFEGQSSIRLVKGTPGYTGLTEPIVDAPRVGGKQIPTLTLTVYPTWLSKHTDKAGSCLSGQSLCYKATKDGKFTVELGGGGFLSDSELTKVIKSVTFADPADTGTWFTATSAVS
jgi:hypothetical protein